MTRISIPILLYHTVSDDPPAPMRRFAVSQDQFRRHLEVIASLGFQALTISQLTSLIDSWNLPERPLAITFDDGFAETLHVAAPELARRQLPITLYVTTGYIDGSVVRPGKMLSWAEVRELDGAGFEVGAHTASHPQLDLLDRTLALREIRRGRDVLTDALGHGVSSFAYPHGYAAPWTRTLVRNMGFESACAVRNTVSHVHDDRWYLARLTVRSNTSAAGLRSWLTQTTTRPVPGFASDVLTDAWRCVRQVRARFTPGRASLAVGA